MKTAIFSFITKHTLIKPDDTIIVGLSGGPDSVFLLHMLSELRSVFHLTLVAAHLNHGWRADAHEDVAFCQQLCQELKITFEFAHASELDYTPANRGSLEDTGRALRRFYFQQLQTKYHAASIALGHHQDDQLETFFIRLARGASLTGLGAMRAKTANYIRPLLHTSKAAILDYLETHAITFRTDSTNDSDAFLRNRIRKMLPLLTPCDARMQEKALDSIAHLQEAGDALAQNANDKFDIITDRAYNKRAITIDCAALSREHSYFQKELIGMWLVAHNVHHSRSAGLLDEIVRFLISERGGEHQLHTTWKIIKKQNKAHIISL